MSDMIATRSGKVNMRLSIVIPWRPQPSRVRAFEHVTDTLHEMFPDAELIAADAEPRAPFSVSASRNTGVEAASGDMLLIVDADSLAPYETITTALDAAQYGGAHFAYDRIVYLDEAESEQVYRGDAPTGSHPRQGPHESSLIAIRRDAYWEAGGYDERFQGYGGEDNAFRIAADTLLGPCTWHPGLAYALWHEVDRHTSQTNFDHLGRYRLATGDPETMRLLIQGNQ